MAEWRRCTNWGEFSYRAMGEGDEEALRCGGERLQWHNLGNFFERG